MSGRRSFISIMPKLAFAGIGLHASMYQPAYANNDPSQKASNFKSQPSFGATTNLKKAMMKKESSRRKSEGALDSLLIVGGSAHPELTNEIASLIGSPIAHTSSSRFADGEVSIMLHDDVFEKVVFVIQPCAAPVNDSVMELLLTVSCLRRAGAKRIVAVIPYYGYKHHRRVSPHSAIHQSRYMTSLSVDFARMLQEMGVDGVISVDLQRPGQGQEACFFDNDVPLE